MAVAAVVVQVGLGSYYAWSVFRGPLTELYGASVTRVNVAFFLTTLAFSLGAVGGGFWMRRVVPRVVGIAGGLVYGLGVFLSGLLGESLTALYVTYGVIAGTGLGLGYIAPVAALPRWFPDRPGLAYGIAVCGFGAGSAVWVPVAAYLLPAAGGPLPALTLLGLAYAALIGGAAFLLKDPPEGAGSTEGSREREGDGADQGGAEEPALPAWGAGGFLGTRLWITMWALTFLSTTAGLAIISDAKAIAGSVGGAPAALASAFVAAMAFADATGRLLWPALSDRMGPGTTLAAMFVLQAIAFALLPTLGSASFALFCVLVFAVLSCYGGGYGVMPALVGAHYGPRDVGAVYGTLITATGFSGFGAPLLLALCVDTTGSYAPALYATAAFMLVGAAVPLLIKPPGRAR